MKIIKIVIFCILMWFSIGICVFLFKEKKYFYSFVFLVINFFFTGKYIKIDF